MTVTTLVVPDQVSMETFKDGLIAQFESELWEAQEDEFDIRRVGGDNMRRLSRAHSRVVRAERKIKAVRDGYLPVPRMDTETIRDWAFRTMPQIVRERLSQVEETGIFERIEIVLPQTSGRRRDPMLVGVIAPGTNQEEHFFIAWWR